MGGWQHMLAFVSLTALFCAAAVLWGYCSFGERPWGSASNPAMPKELLMMPTNGRKQSDF